MNKDFFLKHKEMIALGVILLAIICFEVFINKGKSECQAVSEKAVNFINTNILSADSPASLMSSLSEKGVCKFHIKIGESEYDSYITKDGTLLFPDAYVLEETAAVGEEKDAETPEVAKSDRPDVKVFIMSYCPYGLQAQKMFLPVYELLKDRADLGIYFVDYIMHDKLEIDENLVQYCIQKEESDKYSAYASCFVVSGDSDNCLSQVGISESKIKNCITATDKEFNITSLYNDKSTWLSGYYPLFPVQEELNEMYNVQGSPTIIINGQSANPTQRSPEKFKELVCAAFNVAPEECSQMLSEELSSPGIGAGTGTTSGGSCN